MSVLAVTLIIIVCGISKVLGVPVLSSPIPRKAVSVKMRSCGVLTFTQTVDLARSTTIGTRSKNLKDLCYSIDFPDVPTTIHYNRRNNLGCWYKVVGYSGSRCEDYTEEASFLWNSWEPEVRFNDRKPVCSLKILRKPKTLLTVKVPSARNGVSLSLTVNEMGCYNLCSDKNDRYYPREVTLSERDSGSVAYNDPIALFSKCNCEDGSDIGDDYVQSRDTYVPNLMHPPSRVRSFKIVAIDKGTDI